MVFEPGFGFEHYVDYALDAPMYFVQRDGGFINALGMSFRDFLEGQLPALPGEKPTEADWEDHLTTLFPEARVKRFIEMRGADAGSWQSLCALPAFWVGLLYNDATQKRVADMIADWTQDERDTLRRLAPVSGLATPFRGGTLGDLAADVLALAEQGLQARAFLDGTGSDETQFLHILQNTVARRQTPADILLSKFNGEWEGQVAPIFDAFAF